MISLGLDLSLTGTGCVKVSAIDGSIFDTNIIKSKPPKIKTSLTELERLMKIRDSINTKDVKVAVIEGIAFMARNSTSLAQLSGLNYMVREMLYKNKIPFVIVAPTTLKKFITGKGNCPKDLMLLETYKRYGEEFNDDNVCDAFGLAKIGEALLNDKLKLTIQQTEVVDLLKKQLHQNNKKQLNF